MLIGKNWVGPQCDLPGGPVGFSHQLESISVGLASQHSRT